MVAEPLVIEFTDADAAHRAPVVSRMATMTRNRQGWINFSPGLDMDFPPPQRSIMAGIFTARGPDVPLATWSAPSKGDRDPATVGIQHARGPKVAAHLAELGWTIPEGWRTLQDHPKHGLVCAVPGAAEADDEALDELVGWLLGATGALCRFPRTGEWRALCYRAI